MNGPVIQGNDPGGSGETNTVSNIGTGSGLYKQTTGVDLELRKILASTGISVSIVSDDIVITNTVAALTGAQIKALYEAESDTNAFTDADHSKLDAIEASATADQTGAQIKALYEAESDTNAFTDADHSKLDGISSATVNQSDATLKARANHTGTQLASTISDLGAEILARAKHTGTQLASTISNLATVVKAYRLDEFAIPTADINLNSKSITNLFKSVHKVQTISSTATLIIDMNKEDVAEIDTLEHAPTITTTNRGVGRKKIIHIRNGTTLRVFTFSESWDWRTAIPTNMTASKNGTLSLECVHGTAVTDIIASWIEAP